MVLALEATQFQAEKGMKYADLDKPLHFYGYCLLSYVSKETGNVVVNEEAVTGRKGWVDYLKEALGWNGQDTSIGEGKYVDKAVNFWVREQTKPNGKGGYEISDESLCEPAMAPGGQHHPKDYPHGLRIFIDKLQRDPGGEIGRASCRERV